MYTKVEKADYGVDAFSITTQDDWHYKFHNKFEFESETHENVILTSQRAILHCIFVITWLFLAEISLF